MGENLGITGTELAALITAVALLVGAVGAWAGRRRGARSADSKARTEANHVDNERNELAQVGLSKLVDQLQEQMRTQADELNRHRANTEQRALLADERANTLELRVLSLSELVTGYRDYSHALRTHIFEGLAPPPPDWPEGLAR